MLASFSCYRWSVEALQEYTGCINPGLLMHNTLLNTLVHQHSLGNRRQDLPAVRVPNLLIHVLQGLLKLMLGRSEQRRNHGNATSSSHRPGWSFSGLGSDVPAVRGARAHPTISASAKIHDSRSGLTVLCLRSNDAQRRHRDGRRQ